MSLISRRPVIDAANITAVVARIDSGDISGGHDGAVTSRQHSHSGSPNPDAGPGTHAWSAHPNRTDPHRRAADTDAPITSDARTGSTDATAIIPCANHAGGETERAADKKGGQMRGP